MAPLKIDAHQHIILKQAIERNPDLAQGMKAPDWVLERTLIFMASNNIGTSILSCPLTVCLASIRDRYPTQFGFFATLPSAEDTARCIDEIRYALDILKADGVELFTSYKDNRAAGVFTHPMMEDIMKSINEPLMIPRVLMDWSHETTRTVVHLILTNTMRRCAANCRIILPYGAGTLPFVAGRSADESLADARLFYFDLALVGHALPLQLVMDSTSDGHVLYGTDYAAV
ncbi:hypothetical protein BDW67DRAFT_176782 [Aspergillus spinulosporus]